MHGVYQEKSVVERGESGAGCGGFFDQHNGDAIADWVDQATVRIRAAERFSL